MKRILTFFDDPRNQALGWAFIGMVGVALLAGGFSLSTRKHSSITVASRSELASPTARRAATPGASPSPTATIDTTATASALEAPSPSPTATQSASPAPTGQRSAPTETADSTVPAATATPVPPEPTAMPTEVPPTPAPAVAAGGYCGPAAGVPSPAKAQRLAGRVTVGGQPAAAGLPFTVLFDGVPGASGATVDGGYGITYDIGGANCANRTGAAISVSFKGATYRTGLTVPFENTATFQQYDIASP